MRWLLVGVGCMVLAGCSQRQEAGEASSSADTLAFQYAYEFRLPSQRIAAAQERHAQACEQLGAQRCRITDMRFSVDQSGTVAASLSVKLAPAIARGFGHARVADVEADGGALAGADITGTDTAESTASAAGDRDRLTAEVARLDAALARPGPPGAERVELVRQRAAAAAQAQEARAAGAETRAALLTTPVAFTYTAGQGVGAVARLADAGQTAWASLLATVSAVLTVLGVLGPPALVLLALLLLWRRWGQAAWRAVLARTETIGAVAAD